MRFAGIRAATTSLGILNLVLMILFVTLWHFGEKRVREVELPASRKLAPPDMAILTAARPSSIDVLAIRDNAVFHTYRSFYQRPPPSSTVGVPEYELAGSMGLPQGKRIAFVKSKSDRSNRTIHVGDDLDGWRVEVIDSERVVLVRDEQHIEIKSDSLPQQSLILSSVHTNTVHPGVPVIGQGPVPVPPSDAQVSTARTFFPTLPPPH